MSESIKLEGVTTHNLKEVDATFPLAKVSVVTGVSGSGKSSLVFDSLYAEAYRRYVESLSSFARQFLKALPKPEIKAVKNLPPAIAVRQTRSGASNRSTVGTMTEMNDLLRVIFGHVSTVVCRNCGKIVRKDTPQSLWLDCISDLMGQKVMVTAPLSGLGGVTAKDLKAQLEAQGFTRILSDGAVQRLADTKPAALKQADVIIDRLTIDEKQKSRVFEAAGLAFKLGKGKANLVPEEGRALRYDATWDCSTCGESYQAPSESLFSHNHPLGACQSCQGFGLISELNWAKVLPDEEASLESRGVAPWNFGKHVAFYDWAAKSAKKLKFDVKQPFAKYSEKQMTWLMSGDGEGFFPGILGYFEYLASKRYKPHYRIHSARFHHYTLCNSCEGARLNSNALACQLNGSNFAQVCNLSISELGIWLNSVADSKQPLTEVVDTQQSISVIEALGEMQSRQTYLIEIGLSYLTLARSSKSLSGGELQRIHMARCLGSALTDTLYCLDEPTAGLHARDSQNLVKVIRRLSNQGNTVVVVEHESTLIREADHLIEVGPKAGHEGGQIIYQGKTYADPTSPKASLRQSREPEGIYITLRGVKTNNLKNLEVNIPIGALTAVCGVSGSGKTSLIQHTLFPMVAEILGQDIGTKVSVDRVAASLTPKKLVQKFSRVELVSQSQLGRSSRSNIATFLGVMDEIRKLLAAEPEAKRQKLKPGSFSFNTPGGRCETCRGLGTVVEDLSFLGEMEVMCPTCEGRRFTDEVLSVQYRGKNLIEILSLTVAEARSFFHDRVSTAQTLDIILNMGLGYVTLGQHTSSFSGGEAQRLKLAAMMLSGESERPTLLIFDEPTTGLSNLDVDNLIRQLKLLTRRGHTVVVVEHHLAMIAAADWIIEIGPEAGDQGGELVYEGAPGGLQGQARSRTAPFLFQ